MKKTIWVILTAFSLSSCAEMQQVLEQLPQTT